MRVASDLIAALAYAANGADRDVPFEWTSSLHNTISSGISKAF